MVAYSNTVEVADVLCRESVRKHVFEAPFWGLLSNNLSLKDEFWHYRWAGVGTFMKMWKVIWENTVIVLTHDTHGLNVLLVLAPTAA